MVNWSPSAMVRSADVAEERQGGGGGGFSAPAFNIPFQVAKIFPSRWQLAQLGYRISTSKE